MAARCLLIVSLLLTAALAAATVPGPSSGVATAPEHFAGPIHGMTVSCPGAGQVWGSDAMVETMKVLAADGVEWIAIHPYAGISGDGTVGGRLERMYGDATWLTRPIREAHALGLKVMVKPHLAYWGSPFSWRGEIEFDDEAAWTRFFRTYEAWILMVAALTKDADAFVVGTELDRTVAHDAAWRRIIAAIRERTDASLTYAANWDQWSRVRFWDELDAIGVQAYFPLTEDEAIPVDEALDAAWAAIIARLERTAKRLGKPVIFTELGYDRAEHAARRPWEGGPRRDAADAAVDLQVRCLGAALRAIRSSHAVRGAFLWKWFPGERRRGDFLMSEPGPRAIIRKYWLEQEQT